MTLSKEIIEILDYIGTKFGIAIDWSAENVLPYAQELAAKFISWEIATSWMWIVIGVVIAILGIALAMLDYKTGFSGGLIVSFCVVAIFVAVGVIAYQAYDIITCTHFPELKIYDFLKMKLSS